ncbi:hypothetical protein SLS60_004077 [Paraconiothyrium brasiliense]|uniref:Uncharacterized protein n=1 Tax=Paraconiothyrium brasiliense TaxID=300254 RepID=A0ABR3RQF8_9PLEO
MPSSKGKPTDPKLREKVKEEIQNEPNKDGGGKGQWSAWKVEYEKRGGDYGNEPGTKNEPKKGTPQPKSSGKKQKEEKKAGKEHDSPSPDDNEEKREEKQEEKPKANTAKKASPAEGKKSGGRPKKEGGGKKKAEKRPIEGTRKSARVAGKRTSVEDEEGGEKKKAKR